MNALATKRLLSIDMLRGLAAFAVVLCHAYPNGLFQRPHAYIPFSEALALAPTSYGYAGVYLFFIISGFCIHLKWAKARAAGDEKFTVEFIPFWKRRIRRLYPAYLAALVLYLGLAYLQGNLQWSRFLVLDVVSHLLLIHNLFPETVYTLNFVFWTLAIEEQLYLAYFLLLKLRTRYGWGVTIAICFLARVFWFALGLVLHRKFDFTIVVTEAAATCWIMWALGAVSVEWKLGLISLPNWCRSPLLGVAVLLSAMLLAYIDHMGNQFSSFHRLAWFVLAPWWALGFFFLVNWSVALEPRWQLAAGRNRIIAALTGLGLISYSLYLTHELLFRVFPSFQIATIPLAIGFAWVYFQFFEKPFLSDSTTLKGQETNNETVASTSVK